jgi:lysophospholipase L1-like esterase
MLTVSLLIARDVPLSGGVHANASEASSTVAADRPTLPPELGPRHQLNYQEWVKILEKEARVAAETQPERLTILAGDSISLWFPPDLLPSDRHWLNQGISGETSAGLFERLPLLDDTRPETVFVMIGINDMLQDINDETILENYRKIIRDLLWVHPDAQVVVQSILPHSAKEATWEGRDRLLEIPNRRIREINDRLEAMAEAEGVRYLNLYPLFADEDGKLQPELSTDGLHLNEKGYLVWRSALQLYSQLELESDSMAAESN